jgi:hypothetical protein
MELFSVVRECFESGRVCCVRVRERECGCERVGGREKGEKGSVVERWFV